MLGITERTQVSTSLVKAYDALGESTTLIIALTTHEILSTEDPRMQKRARKNTGGRVRGDGEREGKGRNHKGLYSAKKLADVIFRGNFLGSKALDAYMKLIGGHFLHTTLTPFVTKLYEFGKSCEV